MTDTAKRFKLSETEMKNVAFRRMVMDFVSNAVNNDLGTYIYTDIRPRLGLPQDVKVELSEDGEWLSVIESKPEIIKP